MKSNHGGILILLLTIAVFAGCSQASGSSSKSKTGLRARSCTRSEIGLQVCLCGPKNIQFDPTSSICINELVYPRRKSQRFATKFLRLTNQPIHRSSRDDVKLSHCIILEIQNRTGQNETLLVPLRNISVEASINAFTVDVTLTQLFVNEEKTPIEAVYVFPVEENAAVYSFTAIVDNRTITSVLKEKKDAEKEYEKAISEGRTAVLLRQSEETLDTFRVNIGALPPGKQCLITIKYVSELEITDQKSIRFVVPTTIAPRYNPSLGHLQNPDKSDARYVQKTPYTLSYQVHVHRGENYKIMKVANMSHPMNISVSSKTIDVSLGPIALDRDIILDIDLPENRQSALISLEKFADPSSYSAVLSFAPRLSDIMKLPGQQTETNIEFIFVVDCSGSMSSGDRIAITREALLLFIRSLPLGSHFNIIRFGSNFDVLFTNEIMTVVYNQTTATTAEKLIRSINADFGGTELLEPLKHLKSHPPVRGRSRQIFLLTDGEISNTDEVIELCRSMSSTTRIFSFGIGDSPSRSLVKGLARATHGYFVFVPPNSKVDTHVATQLARALQPSFVDARLQWHGLSKNVSQAPEAIPPLYVDDRVLIYTFFDEDELSSKNISVDVFIGDNRVETIKLPKYVGTNQQSIRRLAAKALIQELQHKKMDAENQNNTDREQRIRELSLQHQILSPYTAFVGIETEGPIQNTANMTVRYVPIQLSKESEQSIHRSFIHGLYAPQGLANNYAPSFSRYSLNSYSFGGSRFQKAGLFGASPLSSPVQNAYGAVKDYDLSMEASTSKPDTVSSDPVRWLIDQQSFDGAWILKSEQVLKLTNGKSLQVFQSTITQSNDVLTTALAIAILESKYSNQKTLWFAVVEKSRQQLLRYGLTKDQANALIDEIKVKL